MAEKHRQKDYLTTSQAARLLFVSPDTVLKWVKAGKVTSYRTLGGHFRIPISELNVPSSGGRGTASLADQGVPPPDHQYCWEYLAGTDEIKPECRECITFRSRARRCYELKDLPDGLGCLNLLCDTNCFDCEYFKLVRGQGLNVLVVSEGKRLIKDLDKSDRTDGLRIRFVHSEYDAGTIIQEFRPDYIVVDCAFGQKRTAMICSHLFGDIRIPVARIILSSKTRKIRDYCNKDVFGWIKKPFTIEQLKEYIENVPKLEDHG